ncbi:VIRB2 type IV secretion [Paracoccus aestuarii]|uniref:VIRB2 type IV secretion n=1 Tax=Paracoccus aestuarii TaxID=453842 RepID=A0A418ZYC7_9RHOB|nr:TrbC/VirB2 family protein [Paracoccus aestuarii]RJL05466.1 VIRB2 type IV secretion [Paracoccus aestuarii]WCR01291.1 TrbC/VirB2 family protein [Paracoccus aestuarii]
MTRTLPITASNLAVLVVLAIGVMLLMSQPALAQGTINLSPITNILTGIASTLTGPLGRAMATLAVIGIGVAWLMGYVDFRTVVYVVAGIAIVAGAGVIVNAMWGN